ncbi:hypothetical protein GLOTRDRAFT_124758 [Gloeophyllum trabeum ATCC 11539]|uniref:Dienelactone hydrolase domain-containing protein n=1 Tax=Gloeophyllum trabeum (strain ATCC 11539 / FP-39264 / Madison 617) TaxID=670483 RepID=S7QNZ6_GLOTA|nr:uncharacterized protein GLOTRDRAFT_124758 [Gloeophyllum trabeum ATCC 11539]EPQ61022.1 hypothetical protein GLOTRDRAFT_124758 [Gloeophyllum trabeum ATCC 11539]
MSTQVHNDNPACCSIPPVQSDYKPQGTYKPYAGFQKVYFTGDEKSDIALVAVYDIFGFAPQTQQGADILAKQLKATLVMPDFFEPDAPWPSDKFPPQTGEEKAKLQEFFGGTANPQKSVNRLIDVVNQLKADGAKHVGAFGFCWGGKVNILAGSAPNTPLDAVAAVHPAMLSSADVENLSIPLGLYPSKDEPTEEYNKILEIIAKKPFAAKNDHKHYTTMFHGFAAARADLNNADNRKQFEDLYSTLVNYFKKTLV